MCPVKIPIPALLRRLREENVKPPKQQSQIMDGQGSRYSAKERALWTGWQYFNSVPWLYKTGSFFATRLGGLTPKKLGPWTQHRSAPKPAKRSLHELAKQQP